MTRVQVMMESEMHKQVKTLAKRRNISTSRLIRETIKTHVIKQKTNTVEMLLKVAQKAEKGLPADLSTNDHYLYGE